MSVQLLYIFFIPVYALVRYWLWFSREITANPAYNYKYFLLTTDQQKKNFNTLRACRAAQPKGGSLDQALANLPKVAADAPASYTAIVYSQCGYPTAFNPPAVS